MFVGMTGSSYQRKTGEECEGIYPLALPNWRSTGNLATGSLFLHEGMLSGICTSPVTLVANSQSVTISQSLV